MPYARNNSLTSQDKSMSSNDSLIVGNKVYQRETVFDKNGHFWEEFYREEGRKIYSSYVTLREHIRIYHHFKNRYPTLKDWFEDEIQERVGRISSEYYHDIKLRLVYRARTYIYHLCLFGLSLDYFYLFSLRSVTGFTRISKLYGWDYGIPDLQRVIRDLKYHEESGFIDIKWVFNRLIMHTQKKHYRELNLEDFEKLEKAAENYYAKDIASKFWKNARVPNVYRVKASLYKLHVILYTLGVITTAPKKHYSRDDMVDRELTHLKHQKIAKAILDYSQHISRTKEKSTVRDTFMKLHVFAKWLEKNYPSLTTFSQLNRQIMNEYLEHVHNLISDRTGKPYSQSYKYHTVSALKVFFDESLLFNVENVPQYKLLYDYHLPRRHKTLPRFIPEQDLKQLMEAIYALKCPYQRNALILLRWTGARQEEIRRLDIHALDYYSDKTPKLFIPLGKTNTSRWVPIHLEAEKAFKELLALHKLAGNLKGLPDRKTGKITEYLFMRKNYLISKTYLFVNSMREVCRNSGLEIDRKPKYSTHQFRHTLGTQMANQGASLTTIMKMLGHQSPEMTIRYAQIHDETLKKDYQRTINHEVLLAGGEYAEQIKKQELRSDEIDWIKANFYKTYLAMGHCFHHSKEPMCDFADACYFCPKFVTTQSHLPTLMEKYTAELQLIEDAKARGWQKEIDRHTNVARRVKQIIRDLGSKI